MRLVFLGMAVLGFVGLGILDLVDSNYRTGVAALLLAVVNLLLLR
jgi:hypothetical protein